MIIMLNILKIGAFIIRIFQFRGYYALPLDFPLISYLELILFSDNFGSYFINFYIFLFSQNVFNKDIINIYFKSLKIP